jgi:hypothetical protein
MFRSRSPKSRRSLSKPAVGRKKAVSRLEMAVATIQPLEARRLLSASPAVFGALTNGPDVGAHDGSFVVEAIDINGDGIPDIIAANYDGTVTIALGKGDGTFGAPQTVSDGLGAAAPTGSAYDNPTQDLAVATVNGRPIIIVTNGQSDEVAVLELNAAQQLVSAGTPAVTSGTDINALTISEINGDYGAIPVLVTANEDGSVTTRQFTGRGSGNLGGFYGFGNAYSSPSIITYNSGGSSTAALVGIVSGDFISSGNGGDLVVLGSNGKISLIPSEYNYSASPTAFFNFGTGGSYTNSYAYNIALPSGDDVTKITEGHFTSGGSDDLVVETLANGIVPILGGGHLGAANGNAYGGDNNIFTVEPAVSNTAMAGRSPIIVGDFNGDGIQDIAFAQQSGGNSVYDLSIYSGNGKGGFTALQTLSLASTNTSSDNDDTNIQITTADLNGDGLPDLVTWRYYSKNDYNAGQIQIGLNQTPTAPSFISPDSADVLVGSSFSFPINLHGFPHSTITLTGTLPKGLTFKDNGDGTATISGTAKKASTSAFPVTLTATNSAGLTNQELTLNVFQPAKFTSKNKATFTFETSNTVFTVKTTGGLADTVLSAANLPAGLTFTDNGNGTGTISGTPTASGISSPLVLITATDGPFQVTQNLTITVLAAPVISSSPATFTVGEGNSFVIDVSDGGSGDAVPAPQTKFKWNGKPPSGLKIVKEKDGSLLLEGKPGLKTAGTYSITVSSKNIAGTATPQTVSLTIQSPAKIDSPRNTTFTVGKAGLFKFSLANGSFPTAAFTEIGTLPDGITFTDNGNGTAQLAGTATVLNSSDAENGGVYPLTIIAANGTVGTALTITALTESGTTVTATVASTTGLATGNIITIAGATPSGYAGTFIITGVTPTTFTYAAAANLGASTLSSATATQQLGSAQTFNLTVLDPAAITSSANGTFTVGTAGAFTVTTDGFPDPTLTASTLPSGLTFVDNGDGTGTIAGIPATGTGGVYTITLGAHNSSGSDTQKFTLLINEQTG